MVAKILIVGSHFTPAQALIEELKDLKTELVYIGRKTTREGDASPSIESKILPSLGIRFIPITTGRLQRTFSLYSITSFLKLPIGFIQAVQILIKEKPQLIVSFGGYVSLPIVIVGWLFSIPIILHEQTLVVGLASQISAPFADKIALSFENKKLLQNPKYALTGNPIRADFFTPKQDPTISSFLESARLQKKPCLLVIGGNQGSHLINQTIFTLLPLLTRDFFIIHQTGESKFNDYNQARELAANLKFKERYLPKIWIETIAQVMENADLAISRAGINTLVELSLFKIPTIVIPLPNIYKDEQVVNAQFFKEKGLSEIIWQKDLTPEKLLKQVKITLANLTKLKSSASKKPQAIIKNGAKSLAQQVLILLEKNNDS